MFLRKIFISVFILIPLLLIAGTVFAATTVPFTVNMSEAVNVTGTPRIAVDVGGVTRYATYASGSGTSALVFNYTATVGDIDLDGVTLTSPIDLNGGTLKDLNGNNATLTFTVPNTSNVKISYPSLSMDFTTDHYTLNGTAYGTFPSFLTAAGATFSRPSTATYFDSSGVMQTAASGAPRFDYEPVTHAAKGILIEESRTNLIQRSAEMNNGYWGKSNITLTTDATSAPDSTTSAEKIIESSNSNNHILSANITVSAGVTATFSVFAKSAERQYMQMAFVSGPSFPYATFDLNTGTVTQSGIQSSAVINSTTITSVGNGWYRCTITGSIPSATLYQVRFGPMTSGTPGAGPNASGVSYAGDGTSGIYVWGTQLEQGSFPTSYIPTTTATVARSSDYLSMPTGSWFNNVEGNLSAKFIPTGTTTVYPQIALFGDNTLSNFIAYTLFPSNTILEEWKQSGSTLFTMNVGTAPAGTQTTMSGTYKNASSALSKNGGAPATSATAIAALPITKFSLGSNLARGSGDGIYTGTYQIVKYYPLRPLNAQLQLLSQ